MKVYRIVELRHCSGDDLIQYVIERRKGFLFKRWKEIFHIEDKNYRRISHDSYEKAEKYLIERYTRQGIGSLVTKAGHVYYVEPYTMYTM
jgi:hypothetical protein